MIDELRLNTKLFGFDGIIGRRDYFLNIIYLCMINLLFMLPLTGYIMSHAEIITDLFYPKKLFWEAGILLNLWCLGGTIFTACISVSNIIRRVNDIYGSVNKNRNIAFSAVFVLGALGIIFLPLALAWIFYLASFVIGLILLFKKGKITGNYPYDFRKEFNWGAFFGTWIWGLFNKSFKTLWMLLLGLTPWGFYYALVCGLKGNEWAYHNKKWESDEKFKSSQETQTIVFVVLAVLVVPIIYFIVCMGIVGAIMFTAIDEAKTSPNGQSTTIEKLDSAMNSLGSLYFESHTITADENKFYVLPKDWAGYSFSEKKDIMDIAANLAASERRKAKGKKSYSYSKTTELKRTKIYSSTNNELLGEFKMDETVMENGDFKSIVKASMIAYRFYKPTKIK